MTTELRPGLPPLPDRIKRLRVHRGYPVPYFVQDVDGVPDFRVMDPSKWRACVRSNLCWICGEGLGKYKIFVAGPMCGINRTSAEPPAHRDCAEFAAKACPFLAMPKMVRREAGLPEGVVGAAGVGLRRNPGVVLLWVTRDYSLFSDGRGGRLVAMGEPVEVMWIAEGREATREEVMASIDGGLPELLKVAEEEGEKAMDALARMVADFCRKHLPAETSLG